MEPVTPVKFLIAVLWNDRSSLATALTLLPKSWGDVDFSGPDHLFNLTDYYQAEMGGGLLRRLVSWSVLLPPESLVEAKLKCIEIERQLACDQQRTINLDVGYLDHNKVVLGSVKYAGQKIHLGSGIYADMVARYRHGSYEPLEWSFPDFRDGRYAEELGTIRRIYLDQLRSARNA